MVSSEAVRRSAQRFEGLSGVGRRKRPVLVSTLALRSRRRRRRSVAGLAGGLVLVAACLSGSMAVPHATPSPERMPLHLVAPAMGNATAADEAMLTATTQNVSQLAPATSAPTAPPPSLDGDPALAPHEVFAFAPYWELSESTTFDVSGLSTIAYFGLGVNPNGTLDESGAGGEGFDSQQFVDLVDRAHAAGDRVVLTVTCFTQSALNELTTSPTAPATLASALVPALEEKNLDGVNLDLEGTGDGDQQGLTTLVSTVTASLQAVNPGWQVTMDTYASSAGNPTGFYDIPALSSVVDGFFVMAYQLNLAAGPGDGSPLTDTTLSNASTVAQYAAVVTPKKVILGLAMFGYDWPTTGPAIGASAAGPPSVVTDGQEEESGHPILWDAVTDTGWTSYTSTGQWHQAFYEDPESLYLAAQLAQSAGLAGVGEWALGFDGNNPAAVDALDGIPPSSTAWSGSGSQTAAGPTAAGPTAPSPSRRLNNLITPGWS